MKTFHEVQIWIPNERQWKTFSGQRSLAWCREYADTWKGREKVRIVKVTRTEEVVK